MAAQPTLATDRLRLRPFTLSDAPDVQRLAGAREVAETTETIPHPYEDGEAEAWIQRHQPAWERGTLAIFAIVEPAEGLVGAVGLQIDAAHRHAELGYWIGVPFWGRGFATEAARALLDFGFGALDLDRIHATHLTRNPASGRVMQKLGMRREGEHRRHVVKSGVDEDVTTYAILRAERAGPAGRVPPRR